MIGKIAGIGFLLTLLGVGTASALRAKPQQSATNNPSESTKLMTPGVVCIGTVDVEGGLVNVYPDCFPLPVKVTKVLVKEGDTVKAGQALLELDTQLAHLNVNKSKAELDRAKALLAQGESGVKAHSFAIGAQEAAIDAKSHELASNRLRALELQKARDKGIPSASADLDAALEALKGLERAIDIERKKLDGLRSVMPGTKVDEAKAGVALAAVGLEQAELALSQMKCLSPTDGTVQRLNITEGSIIGPQSRNAPFTILPTGKLMVRAEVDQEFAHRVTKNMPATIIDYSNGSLTWKGTLSRIAEGFLPKRSNNNLELLTSPNDPGVLECVIAVEPNSKYPLRFGQRVRITLGSE